jgi:uncharacterized protein YeaO (DUF488 family)
VTELGGECVVDVRVKRIYDESDPGDGYRVLIDHLWPRGVSRERACLARFDEFRARYRDELVDQRDHLLELARRARSRPVTIVYAARDQQHNNAVVVAELVRGADA